MLAMPFDNPSTYKDHSGVDYGQPTGKVIKASDDGTVIFVGWLNNKAGWSTIVNYGECDVLYCHQPNTPGIKQNAKVIEGTQIGVVGSSGHSTGPHLHMEIMRGKGAHTYNGIWNYFDRNRVVGDGSTSGGGSANFTSEDDEMAPWIANVKGSFYLIQNVKGQPTGNLLGGASGARESGIPILNFADDWAVNELKKTTILK